MLFWWIALAVGTLAHEAGHFLAARAFGVRVAHFVVGCVFPLARWRDRRGTTFTIGVVPFGGHAGIPDLPVAPRRARLWVIAAGPLANVAVALTWGAFEPFGCLANLTLAAFNVLPAPALDGGQFLRTLRIR